MMLSLARAHARLSHEVAARLGIGGPDLAALLHVHESSRLSAGAVARRVSLPPPTVTQLLDRLESHGYIIRTRDAVDRRKVWIELSERGEAAATWRRDRLRVTLASFTMEQSNLLSAT